MQWMGLRNLLGHVGSCRGEAEVSAGGTEGDEAAARAGSADRSRPQQHRPQRPHGSAVESGVVECGSSVIGLNLRNLRSTRSPPFAQALPFLALRPHRSGSTRRSVSNNDLNQLAEKLSRSQILRDYEHAFSEATGLPLAFQPVGKVLPAFGGSPSANPFCLELIKKDEGCRLCAEMQAHLTEPGADTRTAQCRAGLTDSAVPVRLGQETVGFLQTGQVALSKLNRGTFKSLVKWLERGGAHQDWHDLEKAYFDSPQLGQAQYKAMVRLLEVFAQHLSLAAEQIATQQDNAEPPLVKRARQFIEEHQGEDIALGPSCTQVDTKCTCTCI